MYDLVGVAHVYCCGLFIFFDPLLSLGQSETAVLESSLQQTMAQSISSANWKQLRRADQILQDATTHYFREQGQDGGVQQLVSERDKCSWDGVPTACYKCWHQCAENFTEWWEQYPWLFHSYIYIVATIIHYMHWLKQLWCQIVAVSSMQRMITQIGTPQDNQQLQNQLWDEWNLYIALSPPPSWLPYLS